VTVCLDNIRCMLAVASSGQTIGVGHGQPLHRHDEPLPQKHPRQLRLMPIGEIAKKYWMEIPNHYPNVVVDEFVIMPDHMHGILRIGDEGRNCRGVQFSNGDTPDCTGVQLNAPTDKNPRAQHFSELSPAGGSLSVIIRNYKSIVKRWCNENGFPQFKWQRSFFDHIIRDEQSLFQIRQYIRNNPSDWFLHGESYLKK
jgi:putative transposase